MSLLLPPSNSPLRDLFDVGHLADYAAPANRANMQSLTDVRFAARDAFAREPMVKSINYLCLRANGDLNLVQINRSGQWRRLWNFGAL